MKNISFRPGLDGGLRISAPYHASRASILKAAAECSPGLKKLVETSEKESEPYLFGEKVVSMPGEKKCRELLLDYLKEAVRRYEAELSVFPPYEVKVKKLKGVLGYNAKKAHVLCFSLSLIKYHPHIIDSVVVHELAHYFYFDHGKGFKILLNSSFPDYASCRKHLERRIYSYEEAIAPNR